jgi:hypothetical protein
MRSLKSLAQVGSASLILVLLFSTTDINAQEPAYLHAMSDLRQARQYLEADKRTVWTNSRQHAIDEITNALQDMKVAASRDGKDPSGTAPLQGFPDPNTPIHSALKLLDEAYRDVASGHDRPENVGLQSRSLKHIDVARQAIHNFIDQIR